MRAVIEDAALVSERRYRAFARRAQLEALLPDHLVRGEPYLALNALVLSGLDVALLRDLTEQFAAAFVQAGRRVAADVPGLMRMGFPWVAAELLAAEPARVPLVGRFDFARDEGGRWWLLEFNADTPSGVREAIVVDALVYQLLDAPPLSRPSAGLARALIAAFCAALHADDREPVRALGLVTTAAELEDLAQMAFTAELLSGPLGERGIEVVLGDLANLRAGRHGVTLLGRDIDALYRYVPFEGMLGTPAFALLYEAVAGGRLRLLNGLRGLLLQHKGLLAWLWAHRDDADLAPAARAAVREHLPPTWPIEAYPKDVQPATQVAKQVFGREGEEVFFGEDLDPPAWEALRRRRTYVVQRRVHIGRVSAVIPTSEGPRLESGYPTVGAYVVDGHFAGFYTRFGGKIITSRAKWLATFAEPGGLRG